MSPENTRRLRELGPRLYCELLEFECDDGWFELLRELTLNLDRYNARPPPIAVQVKEKFGGLRFYVRSPYAGCSVSAADVSLISDCEAESYLVCESCGAPGKLKNRGNWMVTRCEVCK